MLVASKYIHVYVYRLLLFHNEPLAELYSIEAREEPIVIVILFLEYQVLEIIYED